MDRPINPKLDPIQSLNLLGGLAEFARQSLPDFPKIEKGDAVVPTLPPSPVQAKADRVDPSSFSTANETYRPAIQDRAVIEALLSLQKKAQTAAAPNPAQAAPETEPEQELDETLADTPNFKPATLLDVQAQPKLGGVRRKTAGLGYPIMRTKGSGTGRA